MPIIRKQIKYSGATTQISIFETEDGVREYHVMIRPSRPGAPFLEQLNAVVGGLDRLSCGMCRGASVMVQRMYLTDAVNQHEMLDRTLQRHEEERLRHLSVAYVQQPSLGGEKVVLYAVLMSGLQIRGGIPFARQGSHGAYIHLWYNDSSSFRVAEETSNERTFLYDFKPHARRCKHHVAYQQFADLANILQEKFGASLADNCVRTWFFVNDIDRNYKQVVDDRNKLFEEASLTAKTHFISSTGIGATHIAPDVVGFNAYAVVGLLPGQMTYLYAPTHLNRTSDYGVSFERGTRVDYGDRRHLFISGTASIDNQGQIVAVGDIEGQIRRMCDNVEALLTEGGCGFDDVMHFIVYLRDTADYAFVSAYFSERFPDVPRLIVHAPVCRPGWLIEMECMAVHEQDDNRYPPL